LERCRRKEIFIYLRYYPRVLPWLEGLRKTKKISGYPASKPIMESETSQIWGKCANHSKEVLIKPNYSGII
jgi:hypothetical protein